MVFKIIYWGAAIIQGTERFHGSLPEAQRAAARAVGVGDCLRMSISDHRNRTLWTFDGKNETSGDSE